MVTDAEEQAMAVGKAKEHDKKFYLYDLANIWELCDI